MESSYNETKLLMKKYKITANKKLGQNFLIDDNVIEKIVESANIEKDDLIIEIGPGLGTLTEKLLEKAGKVICIELDTRMIKILKERFILYKNLEILNEDVLKADLNKIINENKLNGNVKIVANLPYYITTPIIMKLLEEKLSIESITVMIQKEVAKRLSAIPGDKESGAITYTVYYYADAYEILTVPNDSFIPAPEVDSEVIKLKIRKEPIIKLTAKQEEQLFKIIKTAFMQRRKTLINALCNSELKIEKSKLEETLVKLNIDEKVRGETLTLQQFEQIMLNI